MTSDRRPQDGSEGLSAETRALLRKASRPALPTAAERAAMAAMAARIAAVPPPTSGGGLWGKLAGAAGWKGIGIAGLALTIGGSALFAARSHSAAGGGEPAAQAAVTNAAVPVEQASDTARAQAIPGEVVKSPSNEAVSHEAPRAPEPLAAAVPHDVRPAQGHDVRSAASRDVRSSLAHAASAPAPRAVRSAPARPAERAPLASKKAISATPAAAPGPACPSGSATAGDRSAEASILAAAARALASDPSVTLACVQELTRIGGPFQLGDEQAFLAFEASRRLGREADARLHARALLHASPRSAYAARARAFLGND